MTTTVPKDLLDQIHDEMSNYMDDLEDVRTDYSGGRMYGAQCIGWTHQEKDERFILALFMAIREVAKADDQHDNELLNWARQSDWWQLINFLSGVKTDSMGLSTISYFPDLVLEED